MSSMHAVIPMNKPSPPGLVIDTNRETFQVAKNSKKLCCTDLSFPLCTHIRVYMYVCTALCFAAKAELFSVLS